MKCPERTPVQWFMICVVPSAAAGWLMPWHFTDLMARFFTLFIGAKLLFVAMLLNVFALVAFRKYGTPHAPGKTPKHLIETGVFVISRHPVYLSLVIASLGFGFMLDSPWFSLAAMPLFLALDRCVIPREEARIEKAFPETYAAYKARTGRWLG